MFTAISHRRYDDLEVSTLRDVRFGAPHSNTNVAAFEGATVDTTGRRGVGLVADAAGAVHSDMNCGDGDGPSPRFFGFFDGLHNGGGDLRAAYGDDYRYKDGRIETLTYDAGAAAASQGMQHARRLRARTHRTQTAQSPHAAVDSASFDPRGPCAAEHLQQFPRRADRSQ